MRSISGNLMALESTCFVRSRALVMEERISGSRHIEDAAACPGCERMAENRVGEDLSISRRYPRAKITSRFRVSSMHAYDGKLKLKSTRNPYNEFLY